MQSIQLSKITNKKAHKKMDYLISRIKENKIFSKEITKGSLEKLDKLVHSKLDLLNINEIDYNDNQKRSKGEKEANYLNNIFEDMEELTLNELKLDCSKNPNEKDYFDLFLNINNTIEKIEVKTHNQSNYNPMWKLETYLNEKTIDNKCIIMVLYKDKIIILNKSFYDSNNLKLISPSNEYRSKYIIDYNALNKKQYTICNNFQDVANCLSSIINIKTIIQKAA